MESAGELSEMPVPLPDLAVVAEMQLAILQGLTAVPQQRAAGKPVVWTSVVMPKEIFNAMGVACLHGELMAGYASIFGLSAQFCQLAEESGLSRDVCAIHRCAIGIAHAGPGAGPFFEATFCEPDAVVGSNFPCMSEAKSFLHIADRFGCPSYFLDAPVNSWGDRIPDHAVDYYADQLRGLVDFLRGLGYSFELERLQREVAFTRALNTVLGEIETLKQATPHPMRAYDAVIAMTAPLALPQELRSLALFERLRDELAARVRCGRGVVERERLRLLWIGVPPLCDFKLLNYPERHGAVVVKHMLEFLTGFTLHPSLMDPERPFESIARAQLSSPANPLLRGAIDYFVNATRAYRADGVIFVVKRSCGFIPAMQRMLKDAIGGATGVPSLLFDLDGVDQREYDAAATKARLDAFVETLLAGRRC
jgi:benzoyl-CoA reductase/2-hydroxyglutaryl-CoA dehydratase subunit BcrC/BadD/HgdB